MQQIVECIPNFSDGRRPEVYNAIVDAIRGVRGTRVLDVSADADHNRTVITFVGSATAVEEAAYRAIAIAAKLINLDEHQGEHPRIGATDVCPFVPIKGITREECLALAHRLGRRVGEELGIAVYFYAEAATDPSRVELSAIRRGQYELWKAEIGVNPARQPDCGPAIAQPWGATVIGVRPFLIAYNLYLNSDDVTYARQIAQAIRFSSGGLRYIQAKGFLVEGQAQVSMNLTDFEKTPIYRVQELVKREAAHYGLAVTKAELVGMIPQKALLEAAKWYLQLGDLQDDQVLEHRLYDEDETDILPVRFLDATAEATPTPGGGSAAALGGALGAALTQMVAGLTAGRPKYAAVDAAARAILAEAELLRQQLTEAIMEDAAAYQHLAATRRNKQLTESERQTAVAKATLGAIEVPLHVARLSRNVAVLAHHIAEIGNPNAVSDAAVGALLARAAVQAAILNVKINAVDLSGDAQVERWLAEVNELENEVTELAVAVTAVAAKRGGF